MSGFVEPAKGGRRRAREATTGLAAEEGRRSEAKRAEARARPMRALI
jgi:hypothetical protein